MRSWDEPWEISKENRDRPGGHQAARYYRPWKKADKRKARREHRKIIAEAVREFYLDQEYWSHNWYDEFEPLPYHQRYYDEWLDDQIEYQQMIMDWNDLDMIYEQDHWQDFDKEMEDLYDFMYD